MHRAARIDHTKPSKEHHAVNRVPATFPNDIPLPTSYSRDGSQTSLSSSSHSASLKRFNPDSGQEHGDNELGHHAKRSRIKPSFTKATDAAHVAPEDNECAEVNHNRILPMSKTNKTGHPAADQTLGDDLNAKTRRRDAGGACHVNNESDSESDGNHNTDSDTEPAVQVETNHARAGGPAINTKLRPSNIDPEAHHPNTRSLSRSLHSEHDVLPGSRVNEHHCSKHESESTFSRPEHEARPVDQGDTNSRSSARYSTRVSKENDELKKEVKALRANIGRKDHESSIYQYEYNLLSKQLNATQAACDQHIGEIETYKLRIKELTAKNAQLNGRRDGKLKHLQEQILQKQHNSSWNTPSDAKMTLNLKAIERQITTFVNKEMQLKQDAGSFGHRFLQHCADEKSCFITTAGEEFLKRSHPDRVMIRIFLSAWVACLIYRSIFDDRLGFARYLDTCTDFPPPEEARVATTAILDRISDSYGPTSMTYNRLRSDIVRLLEPSVGGVETSIEVAKLESGVRDARDQLNLTITDRVVDKIKGFLKPGMTQDEGYTRLYSIVHRLNNMSRDLSAQRSSTTCKTLRSSSRLVFNRQCMELHNIHSDQDAGDWENKPFLLLVQPQVIAKGASDESETDAQFKRVLRRAVVWMGPSSEGDQAMDEVTVAQVPPEESQVADHQVPHRTNAKDENKEHEAVNSRVAEHEAIGSQATRPIVLKDESEEHNGLDSRLSKDRVVRSEAAKPQLMKQKIKKETSEV